MDTAQAAGPTALQPARAEVELLRQCQRVKAQVSDLTIEAGTGRDLRGLTLIGRGGNEIVAGLSRLESSARRTVWNMQTNLPFDPEEPSLPTNDRSRARGLDLQMVTTERVIQQNPLLTSFLISPVFVGPVHLRTILIDELGAVLEGRPMPSGEGTAWLVTRTDVVADVCAIWHETKRLSRPALPDGAPPPLTSRQVFVASRMAVGTKDAAIARELGVSVRTVVAEVDTVLQFLGATSRCEAGLLMRGRAPNGRMPSGR